MQRKPDKGADRKVIQDGDADIYDEKDDEKRSARWKDKVSTAYTQQKMAGRMPLGLERVITGLLESQVSWRSQLKQIISDGVNRYVVSTWRRPSRKVRGLPGIKKLSVPDIWFLQDTSGSMSEEAIRQGITEVYEAAGYAKMKFICFDADAYDVLETESRQDVITKVMRNIKGGGGTVIGPALKKLKDGVKMHDVVVIFTDGYIYDIDNDETKALMNDIHAKAGTCLFLTVAKTVTMPGWDNVQIKIYE